VKKLARLFQPVDIASLVFFRVAFGALMLWELWAYYSRGWLKANWIDPSFFFTYRGFEWVQPWPGDGMYWHFVALALFAAFILFGFLYRLGAAGFCLAFTYLFLIDKAHYVNHLYLICLLSLLLAVVPAHRAFSIDAKLRPALRSDTAPAWALWLLRAQIGLVYFYAGLAKLNPDWLHGWPMRMTLAAREGHPIVGLFANEEWAVYLLSYGGLIFDLLVVPLLLWPRTRLFAFIVACGFHLTNAVLFQIGVFPWLMIAATTLFFDPDWPRRLFRPARRPGSPSPVPAPPSVFRQRTIVLLLAVYMAVQVIVPLRHYLYPGDASWTEEGHHFAWRLMLRKKRADPRFTRVYVSDGEGRAWLVDPVTYFPGWYDDRMHADLRKVEELRYRIARTYEEAGYPNIRVGFQSSPIHFEVTDPESNETFPVHLSQYLTPRQLSKLSKRPDLILQFSHHLAEVKRDQGHHDIEVRAEVWVSMHARKFQLMVDPAVDLAAEPRSVEPASFIMPLVEPLPTTATPLL